MGKIALIITIAIFAFAECSLDTLRWRAFKTPLKLGVSGTFDKIAFIAGKNCLDGAEAIINKHSVDTKNPGRDKTLDEFFFSKLKGDIKAKVLKVKEKTLDVAITMNGVTKTVPFVYSSKNGVIEAKGVIDIFDFSANSALASIAKACYDKHQGKTWNDVELEFFIRTAPIEKMDQTEDMVKSMM